VPEREAVDWLRETVALSTPNIVERKNRVNFIRASRFSDRLQLN
jgi:hypothetical protein